MKNKTYRLVVINKQNKIIILDKHAIIYKNLYIIYNSKTLVL